MASFRPLSINEAGLAPGYTHIAIITADDLTETVAATLQTITLATLAAGDQMMRVWWYLRRAFEDVSDAAFNSDTISVGDSSAVTTHLAAAEANVNGTEIIYRSGNTVVAYTAASTVTVTVNAMAAKSLVNLDRGELILLFGISRLKNVATGVAAPRYTK